MKIKKILNIIFVVITISNSIKANDRFLLDSCWKVLPSFDAKSKYGKSKIAAEVLTGQVEVPDNSSYKNIDFDDSNWQIVSYLPDFKYSFSDYAIGFNRYCWLRNTFIANDSLKKIFLKNGSVSIFFKNTPIPDCYINGIYLGSKYKETSSGIEFLINQNLIKWDNVNSIAFRVKSYGQFNIKCPPYLSKSSPEMLFEFEESKTDFSHCYIRNNSQKTVKGNIKVTYCFFNKKTVKREELIVNIKPGLTKLESTFPILNRFLNANYELTINEYNFKKEWNLSSGFDSIRYSTKQLTKDTPKMHNFKSVFVSNSLRETELKGLLEGYIQRNIKLRLLNVDIPELIGGYLNQPGNHPWIGEHAGKFLDAACNSYEYEPNSNLKHIMDRVAQNLIFSQKKDGYLGTYSYDMRWSKWDVWSLKYNLIGLLHYYQLSGYKPALNACLGMADLMCKTFGNDSGQRDIVNSGTHMGMAATSILEPMVDLYTLIGDEKYLNFCNYIIESYNHKNGPQIISTLQSTGRVDKVANAKAYEMLSNFVGILKLYKVSNNKLFLELMQKAWEDIYRNRLYITGTASNFEIFQDNHDLSANENDHMGEGCVTTTWLQFNYQLFSITGEMKYIDELERTSYNHLVGAENPVSGGVSYYTNLTGVKDYKTSISCCMSSIPRGISMIPLFVNGKINDNPTILLYEPGIFKTKLNGLEVGFICKTDFPKHGDVNLTIQTQKPTKFGIYFRIPYWCEKFELSVNGQPEKIASKGFLFVERTWMNSDKVEIKFETPAKILDGGVSYPESIAIQKGPQILVYDSAINKVKTDKIEIHTDRFQIKDSEYLLPQKWVGSQAYGMNAVTNDGDKEILLVPFGDAGQNRGFIKTWFEKFISN